MRTKGTLVLAAIVATAVMGMSSVASSDHIGVDEDTVASRSAGDRERHSRHLGGQSTTTPPAHGQLVLENRHLPVMAGPSPEHAADQERQLKSVSFSTKRAGASRLHDFPSLEESTVMFLHVFKCAGTTLRRMMVDWAAVIGKSGAIVVDCDNPEEEGKVCLHKHDLIDIPVQENYIATQKVLAGHFMWGFQRHVRTPYLMITSLRNPLESFVSGQQYLHRDDTETLLQGTEFVSWSMASKLGYDVGETPRVGVNYQKLINSGRSSGSATEIPEQRTGYIRRLIGITNKHIPQERLPKCLKDAMTNLETFWVVGVVEQYPGFEAVLKRLLDPDQKHGKLWKTYTTRRYNTSPVTTPNILSVVDPELVREFNASLSLQWKLYDKAVELWGVRCREILPGNMQKEKCPVPMAPTGYTHTPGL